MTLEQLIAQLRAAISAKLVLRATNATTIQSVRTACAARDEGQRDPSTEEAEQIRGAQAGNVALDAEVDQLRSQLADYEAELARDQAAGRLAQEFTPAADAPHDRNAPGRVTAEARTYTPQTSKRGVSFFGDAYNAENNFDSQARARLERHGNEVRVEREASERATSTSSFAGLIVPQYLVDQAALVARAGRPIANTVTRLQIPEQGTQFQIPRGTTGASAAVQASENTSVSSTDEVWANVTLPVATIAGQEDVSRQSLERGTPGVDELIYGDLSGAYMVAVDAQVISGSGSSGQVLGIVNTSGVNQATAYTAAVTPTTFLSKSAGGVSAIETTRFLAPTIYAMHPRRWNWLLAQVDTAGRPLAVPSPNGPFNALAVADGGPKDTPSATAVGWFLGMPVVTDASIPTAVGTGPEDIGIIYRAQDLLLFEDGDGMPQQLRFEQTLGNQLTVKVVVYGYVAFTAGRYPTAVALVGGNAGTAGFGQVAPSF